MDKEELIQRLLATFLVELSEHVRGLNRDLLALEQNPAPDIRGELLATLFRAAHSLKGASRSVNMEPIEQVCHHMESTFAALRDGKLRPTGGLFELLFESVDAVQDAGNRLRERQGLQGGPLTGLASRLAAAARGEGAAHLHGDRPPAATHDTATPAPGGDVPPAPEKEKEFGPAGDPDFVRIPAYKLDALLARGGELLMTRHLAGAWQGELLALRNLTRDWKKQWQGVERSLHLRHGDGAPQPSPRSAHKPGAQGLQLPARTRQVVTRTREHLATLEKGLDGLATRLQAERRAFEQVTGSIDEQIRRLRMLPFRDGCEALPRVVRDLATAAHKDVALILDGGDVELERGILERLKDPLLHLVRNALDHGIESPQERRTAGKPPRGRVTVCATLRESQVEVSVEDDGRGLNLDEIAAQARKRSLEPATDAHALAQLVFLPGFSTAPLITEFSGRGVGLDVVKINVEAVHGTVEAFSTPGQGTRIVLTVPLTLTTLRGLLVEAGGHVFAFAGTNVRVLMRVGLEEIRLVEGREMLRREGRLVPLVSLTETLGLPAQETVQHGGRVPVVIAASGEREAGFIVNELLDEQELMVKSLGPRLLRVRHVAGAITLASGAIALILNAADLVRHAYGQAPTQGLAARLAEPAPQARKRLLLVEDSVTTRSLEKAILESAGFAVQVATDGAEAWQMLQAQGADLVITDVEMPRMDGFTLTENIRGSKRFKDLPVVLVTGMESDADKARGIEVGADAYLLKSAFNQKHLVETIDQLL